jgi:demethylmenaquinone methyltransferase/2-methoxy-6-polyprenyl-1,4-benzoquinol methylase
MEKMSSQEHERAKKEFFNENAEKWLDLWYKDPETGRHDRFQREFKRLFSLIPAKPGDHVVDLGCGSGVLVPYILEKIGGEGILYEVDYAEKMIASNKRLHRDKRVRFIVSDILAMPLLKGSCDLVICFSCFPHFQQKKRSLEAINHILRQGGSLVISHFDSAEDLNRHHSRVKGPVKHDRLPDDPEMRRLCKNAGFVIKKFINEKGFYLILAESKAGE